MHNYRSNPKNREAAKKRALELKTFLEKNTGAKWKTRVWNNLGWHVAAQSGSISVYPHYYTASAPDYLVMNGAEVGSWHGHGSLKSFNAKSPKKLLVAIGASINEHKKFVMKHIAGYNSNMKMDQFKGLIKFVP